MTKCGGLRIGIKCGMQRGFKNMKKNHANKQRMLTFYITISFKKVPKLKPSGVILYHTLHVGASIWGHGNNIFKIFENFHVFASEPRRH
jgi:hypothetical protein